MELGDHSPGRLHSPPRFPGPDFGRDLRRRRQGPAVEPLGLAPEPERRVAQGLQTLQVGRRLELASERSLAEIVPLRQEPSPVVETRDLFSPYPAANTAATARPRLSLAPAASSLATERSMPGSTIEAG